jgi:hypothetical protein
MRRQQAMKSERVALFFGERGAFVEAGIQEQIDAG